MRDKFAILWAALAALLFATPAGATTLLNVAVTTAVAGVVTTPIQIKDGAPQNLAIQCNFVYGSGGATTPTVDAWVQTSLDGGTTWIDVANCHFSQTSLKQVYNLSALTPLTTVYTPTDGTLASSTAKDGIFGTKYRVKYTVVPNATPYAATTLTVDVMSNRGRVQP